MEEENKLDPNSWALPFGDMITLLMTFFILIISMSTINMDLITESINKNTGLGDNLVEADLRETGLFDEKVMSKLELLMEKEELPPPVKDTELIRDSMVVFITENKLTKIINLESTKDAFSITIRAGILFNPGEAELKEDYLFVLNNIAKLLNTVTNNIRIDGHTDDTNPNEFYNNKLSISRATNVCNYLIREGMLEPARFAIAGHGSYQPLVPNISEENRAKNRRVEIIIKEKP